MPERGEPLSSAPLPEHVVLLAKSVEHADDIVEITDADARIQFVNAAFERLTGYSRDEALGRTPAELLGSDVHPPSFYDRIIDAVRAGRTWSGEIVSRAKDGSRLKFEAVVSPVRDDAGAVSNLIAIKRNVTDRDDMQTKLIESERLASVGLLAAGVAHEINNPLAYVFANVHFLDELFEQHRDALPEGAQQSFREALDDISHGATRIRDIVRDLGTFSALRDDETGPVSVHAVIDAMLQFLDNEIRHRARVVREYSTIPDTWVRRSRLSQVFLNLLLNAVQALPVGAADRNEIRIVTGLDEGDNITVSITDTGPGIPSHHLSRIFEPFFSTKPVGAGTGLGLAVAHRIVTGIGGTLTVSSEVGDGTTFTVTLPRIHPLIQGVAAPPPPSRQRPRGRRVLVVDDEPGVIRVIQRVLGGYELTVCADGYRARELLFAPDLEFDLVLCDLMMPELTGIDLYEQLIADRPEYADRFVFVTGGAFTARAEEFLLSFQHDTISKPFAPAELRALVRRRLGP